jgi:hypothetical protein
MSGYEVEIKFNCPNCFNSVDTWVSWEELPKFQKEEKHLTCDDCKSTFAGKIEIDFLTKERKTQNGTTK